MTIESEVEEVPTSTWSLRKRILQGLLSFALAGAVLVFVLPQIADLSEVWKQIQAMTGLEIVVLILVAIWNLATYWIVIHIATPGITYPQALVVAESTTAVANTVPAGGAVSLGLTYAMLGSWGFSKSRVTLSVLVSGIWNNFAKLALPIVAVSLLALEGGAGGGRILSALIGFGALIAAIVIFALILKSEELAARIGNRTVRIVTRLRRIIRKGPVHGYDLAVVKFRSRVIGLVRHRWMSLTFWTIVSHLSLFAVLLTALRQVGVSDDEVSWTQVLAVFVFARLLTAIPLTPGGLGVIELALIGGLDAAGGDHVPVVGAVLVFRLLTYVAPIPLGLVTYLFWRRNESWRDSVPLAPTRIHDPGPHGSEGNMTDPAPVFDGINLVVADMESSVAFYRRLGLTIPDQGVWDNDHRNAETPDGLDFDLDSTSFAPKWNAGWPGTKGRGAVVFGFKVPTRDAVDRIHADLTGAGYHSQQEPYDVFWGSRYAVVEDPDGNAVGLMSPMDDAYRSEGPPPS